MPDRADLVKRSGHSRSPVAFGGSGAQAKFSAIPLWGSDPSLAMGRPMPVDRGPSWLPWNGAVEPRQILLAFRDLSELDELIADPFPPSPQRVAFPKYKKELK